METNPENLHAENQNTLTLITKNLQDIVNLLSEKPQNSISTSIFSEKLGCLESIVKFLKENKELTFHEIATLLNRDQRTIWSTYQKAKKKSKIKLSEDSKFTIPLTLLATRKYSVLGSLVKHLKENYNLSFKKIATLLQRDYTTIWITYNKVRKQDAH